MNSTTRKVPGAAPFAAGRRLPRAGLVLAVVASVALLVGCGDKKDKAASQTAAKVNKDEITVHQINFVLQQQRNLRPEQADAASRQVLGVHMLGTYAPETIWGAAAVLETELSVDDLRQVVFPHPTVSEGIREAAWALKD